jgi:tryptophanyl-tRNA synthetase
VSQIEEEVAVPEDRASLAEALARSQSLERRLTEAPGQHRVLTGDRPTGPLHLGHYFGTLENRVRLQAAGVEVFVLIADYQTITDRDSPATLPTDVETLLADYLAVGIDPERATIFAHSQVLALNQLVLPFLSLVSVQEISRNPTVKDEVMAAGLSSMSGLMFSYPVHQAADILFCKATVVPVGRDQLPHIELTRTIARRFNSRYGNAPAEPFPLPDALLSDAPLLLGMDGQKMSKSRSNSIPIRATQEDTAKLIAGARTDSVRHITYEPATRPEVANLLLLGALCLGREPQELADDVGTGGSAALKRVVTEAVNERFREIRRRRADLATDPAYLREVLNEGNQRASAVADATLAEVMALMHTDYS